MDYVLSLTIMKARVQDKKRAIELRRLGYSYNDIIREFQSPLAKSTLSVWLKDMPLTDEEKFYLKKRKSKNISRGRIKAATAHRRNRLEREKALFIEAKKEFENSLTEPFFYIGIALYWAEGTKRQRDFSFTNSDPDMIALMIKWVETFLGVTKKSLSLRLYIHKPYAHENLEEFWSQITGVDVKDFSKTIYKPTNLGIKKRPAYKGCLQIRIKRSRNFFLKTQMWQNMLVKHYQTS
jgi:hypothetical protein